jgi:hypothetical protein
LIRWKHGIKEGPISCFQETLVHFLPPGDASGSISCLAVYLKAGDVCFWKELGQKQLQKLLETRHILYTMEKKDEALRSPKKGYDWHKCVTSRNFLCLELLNLFSTPTRISFL